MTSAGFWVFSLLSNWGCNVSYSVHMISPTGLGCYLSVKGRAEWKTKRHAKRHAVDIRECIERGRNIFDAAIIELENEFGEVVETIHPRTIHHACDSCGKITRLRPYYTADNISNERESGAWHLCPDCYPTEEV